MKPISRSFFLALLCVVSFCIPSRGQTFGTVSSAVWLTDCNQSNFFNTSGNAADLPGPAANEFNNASLGVHTRNSNTLILSGAEVRTFKNAVIGNVCNVQLYYRIYLQSGAPGSFNAMDLPLVDNCDVLSGQYGSGGSCQAGDQKWNRVIPNGTTTPYSPVNLTTYPPGNYVLEIYYDVKGSSVTPLLCDETVILNNGGNNYKAFFSIQEPDLASYNPTTCNGTEGSVTISGLVANTSYALSYTDDGVGVGPVTLVSNGAGQVVLGGLNAGVYSDFELQINGCITDLYTGIILSNPVFTPTFTRIAAFCAGTTPPVLPATSNNGINGVWSPAVIDNQKSGSYTFTPNSGQCGLNSTINVTVIPRTVPNFLFGTSLTICAGGPVLNLPTVSTNSITGTWNPLTVDNQNSATYTFTPASGLCATTATLTVTVSPNIPPTFSIGNSLTICAGEAVPVLPSTSLNGITGTWSPSSVDNQNSAAYTFTPTAGLCATKATFTVTVDPNVVPTFGFGTSLTICAGEIVPTLPGTSDNGITGSWSPAIVDNQNSGTYTFTPTGGLCATPFSLRVTVNPNVPPTFSFGTSLTICAGEAVPILPNLSTNNISGAWSPATVDNQNAATYTFTPAAGVCATTATFTVSVNPNIPPTFSFGTALTICAGEAVPLLPATSTNGITGTWNLAIADNQNSGTYTFTPTTGVCATNATFSITVNPNITPTFSFGTSLTICAGDPVPPLPTTSNNGISGTWSPATAGNQNSATYNFTPSAGQCATATSFDITVTNKIKPVFGFGTSLTICAGSSVPALPSTSDNGISGTWSPSIVNNQNSDVYTFTPTFGCTLAATFSVTINPNITPTFSFGTSVTICEGSTVPSLTTTSSNGITGTWSPATVKANSSGVYTFTPTSGLCATATDLSVTIDPIITPTFSFGTTLTICAGDPVPPLPTTSDNGINGTWNPAAAGNQNSATYNFTPAGGQCATATSFNITVTNKIKPVFSFVTSLTICAGGSVPTLPPTSDNNISGTWSPSIVDNQNSDVYTFTPSSGCTLPATFSVTVNPNITPTFSFGTSLTICAGGTVPPLTTTSSNGITGTWSPASVKNFSPGVYTFTPTAGLCATQTTFSVTVNPNITPTFSFGTSLTICAGAIVPNLPATSDNGISGSWNPATVDDQNSGIYTFTPALGICAVLETFSVTVNPNIKPTFNFGTSLSICAGNAVPALPAISTNGISGTWSPSSVDNQNSGTYTFTPDPGMCTTTTTFIVTVNSNVTPAFSFGSSLSVCSGSGVPALVTTSVNAITGNWNPAVIDNQNSGTYTFTPSSGLCANSITLTVTVDPKITPTFSFGTSLSICAGAAVPILFATSDNGITGSWNASAVANQNSAIYTFTPTSGLCAFDATFNVTVDPNITPTFSFGKSISICKNAAVPSLPSASNNGISGSWNPAVIDDENSATYTFTPSGGQCAIVETLTVTVNPVVSTTFDFGSNLIICSGSSVPLLPATSNNGISGSWNPAMVDNESRATYTFTPAAGQCGTAATLNVTVTPSILPTFSFGTTLSVCTGGNVPPLPGTSENGYDGSWSPAIVSNQVNGVYTFTPSTPADQCIRSTTFTVTVNPILTPVFSFGTTLTVCSGRPVPDLPATSTNGIKGTWSPATVSNQVSGVYTFTSAAGQCAQPTTTFTVTVSPTPSVFAFADTAVFDGSVLPATIIPGTPAGVTFSWTNNNTSIGLPASGSGNVPSFTALNRTDADATATVSVTPSLNGCNGAAKSYTISVRPLNKDVFVPNVFSPNGDGKNDVLYVYGNYIVKLEMRIFNQWGEQVELINNRTKGWDGTQRGKAQPVGVYVYVLKAELSDGRKVNLKGSITLVK